MSLKKHWSSMVLAALLAVAGPALAGFQDDVAALEQRWAEINYHSSGDDRKIAFERLVISADKATRQYSDHAEAWIWSGIIKSTFAGVRGGLGALKYAKQAREDLQHALELDDHALLGSAYTTLGSLYYNVPGWPVGFGDDKKAEVLLRKALEINPGGIDSNYFYADFLISRKRYSEAQPYLQKARSAPARPGRELADQGRQNEIAAALAKIETQLE